MTLFASTWPSDASSTSECYTTNYLHTHRGEELAQEGLFFHHETGQCEVELISRYTDALSTKGKHISRHFHNLKFTLSVPKNIHNQTMEGVSLFPWSDLLSVTAYLSSLRM